MHKGKEKAPLRLDALFCLWALWCNPCVCYCSAIRPQASKVVPRSKWQRRKGENGRRPAVSPGIVHGEEGREGLDKNSKAIRLSGVGGTLGEVWSENPEAVTLM